MKSVALYFSTNQLQARRNSGFSGMFVTGVEQQGDQESEMLPQGHMSRNKRHRCFRSHCLVSSNDYYIRFEGPNKMSKFRDGVMKTVPLGRASKTHFKL